jgi:hypothetical protein
MINTHSLNLSDELGEGFDNFVGGFSIAKLFKDRLFREVPDGNGIYVVVSNQSALPMIFLPCNKVNYGCFPGISIYDPADLNRTWTPEVKVQYIGKADHKNGAGLRHRIRSLVKFAYGENKGHKGGRSLWHLKGYNDDSDHFLWEDLTVFWKSDGIPDPGRAEAEAIAYFKAKYKKRPFANRNDGSPRK